MLQEAMLLHLPKEKEQIKIAWLEEMNDCRIPHLKLRIIYHIALKAFIPIVHVLL